MVGIVLTFSMVPNEFCGLSLPKNQRCPDSSCFAVDACVSVEFNIMEKGS
jgi:hypothetical protein